MILPQGQTATVADVMTPHPICIDRTASVMELAELLDANSISGVPVIDDSDRLVGVVSRTDLVHRCLEGPLDAMADSTSGFLTLAAGRNGAFDLDDLGTVEDFMTPDPVTVLPTDRISAVASLMCRERVHRVMVVDERRRPIGLVTTLDLLQQLSE